MVGGGARRDWLVHWAELHSMISDSASKFVLHGKSLHNAGGTGARCRAAGPF